MPPHYAEERELWRGRSFKAFRLVERERKELVKNIYECYLPPLMIRSLLTSQERRMDVHQDLTFILVCI